MYTQGITKRFVERLREHPFIARCRDGSVTRTQLNTFVAQHAKYSSFFTRYLCALISNLTNPEDVLHLAANLSEELGFGTDQGDPHSVLFERMLTDLGVHGTRSTDVFPETDRLISTTFYYCRQRNPAYGLGALCLGAEAVVPSLYSDIICGFIANGVPRSHLYFFEVHVECDDGHAEAMHDILLRLENEDPNNTSAALESAHAMIEARLYFLTGIMARSSSHGSFAVSHKES